METSTVQKTNAQKTTTLEPQKDIQREHRWLQQLIGEWTYETEAEGTSEKKATGTEVVKPIGEYWIVAEGQGEMHCQKGLTTTVMSLGYDSKQQKVVGTWMGSMMSYLWSYEGELDANEKVLTLNSEGPDMTIKGKLTHYKDIIELKSADFRVMSSYVLDNDGQWQKFMVVNYRRKQ